MLSFLIFILILSVLIIVHEFGHFLMAKIMAVKIERFSLGFGPKLFSKKIKDTQYSICAIPMGGFVKLSGDNFEEFSGQPFEYLSRPTGQRASIVFAGPILNYFMALVCFWMVYLLGYPTLTSKVGELIDGYGAKEAGILPQDKISAIDGISVEYWEQLQKIVQDKKEGEIVQLQILRSDKQYSFPVKIKQADSKDLFGLKKTVGLIGITPAGEIIKVKHSLKDAVTLGTKKLFRLTIVTYRAIIYIITGRISIRESVSGPLGIFYITSQAAQLGFIAVLHVVAVLNISLAIFNLLPIPMLDGGHLLLLGIEKIKGGYLSPRIDKIVNQLGFSFIMLLAIFIFYNDLVRFGILDKVTQLWLKR
jgi:regulator of sigma E protease